MKIPTIPALFLFLLFPFLSVCQPNVEKWKDQLEQAEDDSMKVVLLNKIARHANDHNKGLGFAKQALSLAKFIGNEQFKGEAYYWAGMNYYKITKLDTAVIYSDSARMAFEKAKYLKGLARSYNLQAIILWEFSSFEEIADRYQKAFAIYDSIDDVGGMLMVISNLGVLNNVNGRFAEGLKKSQLALEMSTARSNTKYIARAMYNIGISHKGLQNLEEALNHFTESYQIRKTIEHTGGRVECLVQMATLAFESQGQPFARTVEDTIQELGFANVYAMMDTIGQWGIDLNRPGLINEAYKIKISGYETAGNFEEAFYLHKEHQVFLDSTLLTEENISAMSSLKTRLENEAQKNRIQGLEIEKERQEFKQQQRSRERNTFAFIAALLLVAGTSIWYALRQRLNANKLKFREMEQEKQIASMNAMLAGQEGERERISKDLHDGLGNLLSIVKIQLNNIQKEVEGLKVLPIYQNTSQLVDEACIEVRNISHDMMPVSLQKLGLVEALAELCNKQDSVKGPEYHFQFFGEISPLETSSKIMAYRICQELINNINKHAQATEAIVQLTETDGQLFLTVEDDGKGFDPNKIDKHKSLGLRSIESRVNYLNGKLNVESKPGRGTSVTVEIPVP